MMCPEKESLFLSMLLGQNVCHHTRHPPWIALPNPAADAGFCFLRLDIPPAVTPITDFSPFGLSELGMWVTIRPVNATTRFRSRHRIAISQCFTSAKASDQMLKPILIPIKAETNKYWIWNRMISRPTTQGFLRLSTKFPITSMPTPVACEQCLESMHRFTGVWLQLLAQTFQPGAGSNVFRLGMVGVYPMARVFHPCELLNGSNVWILISYMSL